MGMRPDEFFYSFVQGNYEDFCHNPHEIRLAFNAAVAAAHFADTYFFFNKKHNTTNVNAFQTIGQFVEHLSVKTNGAFKDIRSISNAYKHLYTDGNSGMSAHSTINSSGSIESIKFNNSQDILDMEGHEKIIYTRKDGTKSEFLPALEHTIEYLCTLVK